MRTPRLPVVDWTDTTTDLNGLVRFAERRNLVSAHVPSHFKCSLTLKKDWSVMLKFCIHSWLDLWGFLFAGMWCFVISWKCTDIGEDPPVPIVRIPRNACSFIPKCAASHSRRQHSLWLLLWEQVPFQWHRFSHLHISNPCFYGLSVILAPCGELCLEESMDLSRDRLRNEWMFMWNQIFVNISLLQLLGFVFLFNCICTVCSVPITILTIKGKAIPLQSWSGPEGSKKLRFPDF